jgi:hypothetical protein
MASFKFRVWADKMIYFSFDDIGEEGQGLLTISEEEFLELSKFDVMQCTGVKDTTGKEIYERDLVKVLRQDSFRRLHIAEVYFAGGVFATEWWHPLEKRKVCVPLYNWPCEIVGNAYENEVPPLDTSPIKPSDIEIISIDI